MNVAIKLEKHEVSGLENIAEGRVAAVPEDVASRLLAMGLVQPLKAEGRRGLTLQLTPRGLSFIRSSDQ